jgi:hypothetical protein
MNSSHRWKWLRSLTAALVLLFGGALACRGGPACCEACGPRCLKDLEGLSVCQLADLYTHAELGRPFVGVGRGRLVYLTDRRLNRFKLRTSAAVWRGKAACENGYFVNRWVGGVRRIDSHYVIGPSWVDGKPSVIMEYAPGTALFANMHDELREIAPGLYLGPVFERFPCPKFRGYVALQLESSKGCGQ